MVPLSLSLMCKSRKRCKFARLWEATEMSIMVENQGTVFGAIKLIEQLYLDGQIPDYIFRNIQKEYRNDMGADCFNCYASEASASDGVI